VFFISDKQEEKSSPGHEKTAVGEPAAKDKIQKKIRSDVPEEKMPEYRNVSSELNSLSKELDDIGKLDMKNEKRGDFLESALEKTRLVTAKILPYVLNDTFGMNGTYRIKRAYRSIIKKAADLKDADNEDKTHTPDNSCGNCTAHKSQWNIEKEIVDMPYCDVCGLTVLNEPLSTYVEDYFDKNLEHKSKISKLEKMLLQSGQKKEVTQPSLDPTQIKEYEQKVQDYEKKIKDLEFKIKGDEMRFRVLDDKIKEQGESAASQAGLIKEHDEEIEKITKELNARTAENLAQTVELNTVRGSLDSLPYRPRVFNSVDNLKLLHNDEQVKSGLKAGVPYQPKGYTTESVEGNAYWEIELKKGSETGRIVALLGRAIPNAETKGSDLVAYQNFTLEPGEKPVFHRIVVLDKPVAAPKKA
jgi:hypothetical protein